MVFVGVKLLVKSMLDIVWAEGSENNVTGKHEDWEFLGLGFHF